MNKFLFLLLGLTLTGCSLPHFPTEEERLNACEAKGISRDVCYQVDRSERIAERDRIDRDWDRRHRDDKKEKDQ